MAFQFVDGAEYRAENIITMIYGLPGTGKTTLAMTAKNPAVLDFDLKAHKTMNKRGVAVMGIVRWSDVGNIQQEDAGLAPYDTIVIDTVGTALESMIVHIIATNPKLARQGALTLQGYGVLRSMFTNWLDAIKSQGKDIVLVAHNAEEQVGDDTVDRIVAVGSSRNKVYQEADVMGCLYLAANQQRVLTFSPTPTRICKNVGAGLKDIVVPDPRRQPDTLAQVIASAKGLINEESEVHNKEFERLESLRMALEPMKTLEEFETARKKMTARKAPPEEKAVLVQVAGERGFVIDKKDHTFKDKEKS